MTEKELLYIEDAIGHEKNIIIIINETIKKISNTKLLEFMNDEIKTHQKMYKELQKLLEVKANE